MRKNNDVLAALALGCIGLLFSAPSCKRTQYRESEQVVSGADGRYWVSGTEGFGAVSKGDVLVRSDYPRDEDAPDYAYAPSIMPATHLLPLGGQVFLMTRYGDTLVFRNNHWELLPEASIRKNGDKDSSQVNALRLAPDGRIVIHIHAQTLLWTSEAELLRGVFRREALPSYFSWIGFLGPSLYALGWKGEKRAVLVREREGEWKLVEVLPAEYTSGTEPYALVRPPGMPISVVVSKGLIVLKEEGGSELVPVDSLLRRSEKKPKLQIAAPNEEQALAASPSAPSEQAGASGLPLSPNSPPSSLSQARPPEFQETPKVAVKESTSLRPGESYIMRVLSVAGRAPILVLAGANPGVLELAPEGAAFTHCPEAVSARGAVLVGDILRLITLYAEQVDVRAGACKQISKAFIVTE